MLGDLLRRSFWLAAGAAVGRLLPLAVLLLASRRMDTREFASASAGYAWLGVATSLTSVGLATVMTQRLGMTARAAEQLGLLRHYLARSVVWAAVLALVVIVAGQRGGSWVFGTALDAGVFVPAAIAAALWSQVNVSIAALNGCHRPRAASALLAAGGVLQGGVMAVALFGFGAQAVPTVWGLCVGSVGAAIAAALLLQRALGVGGWRHFARSAAPVAVRAPRWLDPVLWNSVAAASALPVGFFASAIVARGNDGARQLAQYFALEQVHQLLVYIPAIVGQAALPLLSRRLAQFDDVAQRHMYQRRIAQLAMVSGAIGVGVAGTIAIDAGWLVRLLGNPALSPADAWAVRWMLLNAGWALALSLLGSALLGAGRFVVASSLNVLWGVVFLALTATWAAQGNTGLQQARFAASTLLATTATLLLLGRHQPARKDTH